MPTKDEIIAALPKLQRAELEAVHALAGHLLGATTGATEPGAGTVGQAVFDALVAALGLTISYSAIAPSKPAQLFNKKLPDLIKFLNTHFEGWDENKVGQLAFLRMIFGLVVDDLKDRGVTPSIGIVISNISRIPEVFGNAFPGYLEAGMGQMILKNFK